MTAWEEAVATALVGTERRPAAAAAAGALEGLGISLGNDGGPEALLSEVAVLAARRAAGWVPDGAGAGPSTVPEPAPADDRPPCSDTAVQVLELLLQGDVKLPAGPDEVVGEWLALAARSGRRPPPRLLPRLLELGVSRPELRPALLTVIGPRGRWLARANPDWRRLAAGTLDPDLLAAAEARFRTGTRVEREQALAEVRRADPARGRELLSETWSTDGAADRAALLPHLETGLSGEDEPFLEAALDDRAKSVRAVAAELLERLPSSRRAARMAARLQPLVERKGVFRKKLEVAYPDEPDKAGRRDGITDDAPSGLGPRAWWLFQLVAGTPLSFWTERTGQSPADLIAAGAAKEVHLGWERAAERQGNAEWARLLFQSSRMKPGLLAALPAEEQAELVGRVVVARSTTPKAPQLAQLLAAVPGPWPLSLSEAVVDRYRHRSNEVAAVHPLLPVLAERLDPAVSARVEAWVAETKDDYNRRHLSRLHHALTLRRTIAEELL